MNMIPLRIVGVIVVAREGKKSNFLSKLNLSGKKKWGRKFFYLKNINLISTDGGICHYYYLKCMKYDR